jgi:DNA replication initiation complex subunit (GINS family)
MMLQDEIKKLDKRMCQIYEMRERKIALASLSSTKPEHMSQRDSALYEELVEVLVHYRTGNESRVPKTRTKIEEAVDTISEVVECQTEFVGETAEARDKMLAATVVHVLEDIPPFVDVDQTYTLKKNDIVTLPTQFADLLSSKGKVKIVEV